MLIDLSPLKKYRDFRLLFLGQMVSVLGNMVSYVAIPYQVYSLTKNNALVGALGVVQFVPMVIFSLLGGTYADRLDRRKLLLYSEATSALLLLGLAANAMLPKPSLIAIFIFVALLQSVTGFHRPSMEAITQQMVEPADYPSVGALRGFRYSIGAIVGPSLGGAIIAGLSIPAAFLLDGLTFVGAFIAISLMSRFPRPEPKNASAWKDTKEGLQFAISKPELIGTYIVDIVAMIFAFPVALYPAMSQSWGGAAAAGVLFSSMAVGSLTMTLLSGWTKQVKLHGRAVVFSATAWAFFIIGVGFAPSLWLAFGCLALAGAADMVSGLFRNIIWNETVPNSYRGRLSGLEMISYMSGPLLGNARAGWVAAQTSVKTSLVSGGVVCTVALIITAILLPQFWGYRSKVKLPEEQIAG